MLELLCLSPARHPGWAPVPPAPCSRANSALPVGTCGCLEMDRTTPGVILSGDKEGDWLSRKTNRQSVVRSQQERRPESYKPKMHSNTVFLFLEIPKAVSGVKQDAMPVRIVFFDFQIQKMLDLRSISTCAKPAVGTDSQAFLFTFTTGQIPARDKLF